jgi:hypothetical protein
MLRGFGKVLLTIGILMSAAVVARAQHSSHLDTSGIQAAILTNRGVQRELKLDEAQSEKVEKIAAEVAAKGRAAAKEYQALSKTVRRQKMHKLMTEACEEAMTAVRGIFTAEQSKRFDQIVLQQRGVMAFADPEIEAKLKLTDDQKDRVIELAGGLHAQLLELSKTASPGKMEDVHEQGLALSRKIADQIVSLLDTDQKATWNKLTGDRFDVKFESPPAAAAH